MDHPITEFDPCEIVEAVTGAVAYDDVFGIDGTEFGNRPSDVVVIERWHDVKPADDSEHLIDARDGHRRAHRIDDAAMTARREHHETASLHVVDGGDLVIKVVRDVTTCVLFGWHLFGKQPKPSTIPMISVVGRKGVSNETCPMRPVVKA